MHTLPFSLFEILLSAICFGNCSSIRVFLSLVQVHFGGFVLSDTHALRGQELRLNGSIVQRVGIAFFSENVQAAS